MERDAGERDAVGLEESGLGRLFSGHDEVEQSEDCFTMHVDGASPKSTLECGDVAGGPRRERYDVMMSARSMRTTLDGSVDTPVDSTCVNSDSTGCVWSGLSKCEVSVKVVKVFFLYQYVKENCWYHARGIVQQGLRG